MDFASLPGTAERYVKANQGRVPVLFAKRDASGEWILTSPGVGPGPKSPAGSKTGGGAAPSMAKSTAAMMKRDLLGTDVTLSGRVHPDLRAERARELGAAKAKEAEEALQRRKAEEAQQLLEKAKQAKQLPSLKTEDVRDLQEVEKRGAVEVVKAQEAPHDQPPPEPAPGVRFIVLRHPSLVGQHGTLLQPARGAERWSVRMDTGEIVELEASQFGLAPPPLAQVSFKHPIDFKRVHHGDPPIAAYTDEAGTMRLLKDAASVLKVYGSAVVSIEGHTATPDSKMDDWAQELAQGRADKIKDALVSLGIDQNRLKPIGLPGKLGGMNHDVVLKLVGF